MVRRQEKIYVKRLCFIVGCAVLLLADLAGAEARPAPLQARGQDLSEAATVVEYTFGYDGFNYTTPYTVGYTTIPVPSEAALAIPLIATKLYAFDVYLSDCAEPWPIAMAQDRNMFLAEALQALARIPVGIRRFISSVSIVAPQGTMQPNYPFNWWNNGSAITCAGVCDQPTFIHLAAQSMSEQLGYGSSPEWQDAVDSDSCVATKLSTLSYENAFAESVVFAVWKANNGAYPTGKDWSCMSNQFKYLDSLPVFNSKTLLGNTCDIQDGLKGINTIAPPTLTDHTTVDGGYTTMTPSAGATPAVSSLSLTAAPWSVPTEPDASSAVPLAKATQNSASPASPGDSNPTHSSTASSTTFTEATSTTSSPTSDADSTKQSNSASATTTSLSGQISVSGQLYQPIVQTFALSDSSRALHAASPVFYSLLVGSSVLVVLSGQGRI